MRQQDMAAAPEGGQAPPPRRRVLKKTLIFLATALLAVAALVCVWGARRYQQAIELARRTTEQYGTLNTSFPFAPPAAGQAIPEARWQALLRVRRRILEQASPVLRQTLHALLGATSLREPRVYTGLMGGIPLLGRTLEAQISALRTEQMAAREYQWMLGLAISEALRERVQAPTGQGYWGVLDRVARLAREGAGSRADARATAAFFARTYQGAAAPGARVLQALQSPDEADYALDLLLASAQWAEAEGQSSEGMMRRLLPQH